jgi:hypothetical protein
MNSKKTTLSGLYKQLLDENSTIMNTLDVFNFQIKLLGNDIVYLTTKYKQTNNRIYCQYYKLFISIQEYVESNVSQVGFPKASFPTYDDTNPDKVYEFSVISEVHDTTCGVLRSVIEYLKFQNTEYKRYKLINNSGVYIDVFVDTFKYKVRTIIEKINLFSDILKFYNTTNVKHYTKLVNYIEFINQNMCNDIAFNDLSSFCEQTAVAAPSDNAKGSIPNISEPSETPKNNHTLNDIPDTDSHVAVMAHYFDSIDKNSATSSA